MRIYRGPQYIVGPPYIGNPKIATRRWEGGPQWSQEDDTASIPHHIGSTPNDTGFRTYCFCCCLLLCVCLFVFVVLFCVCVVVLLFVVCLDVACWFLCPDLWGCIPIHILETHIYCGPQHIGVPIMLGFPIYRGSQYVGGPNAHWETNVTEQP